MADRAALSSQALQNRIAQKSTNRVAHRPIWYPLLASGSLDILPNYFGFLLNYHLFMVNYFS